MRSTDCYFAYGSNMNPTQMAGRCPGAEPLGVVSVDDWHVLINKGGVATIVPGDGERVLGVLWRVTPACVETLDRYEGVAGGYYRKDRMVVADDLGCRHDALVYLAADERPGVPRPGYLEGVLAGASAFELPTTYRSFLASLARRAA